MFNLLLSVALAASAPAASADSRDWAATARSDIEAGYKLYVENHPGPVNSDDPAFKARLDKARAAGLAAAAKARDHDGYVDSLAAFSTVLGDGHAKLVPTGVSGSGETRWPGFLAAWRGDRMVVVDGEAAPGFGPGSAIVSCDGVPIAELLVRRLAPRAIRLDEAGQWWAYGSRVLTDGPLVAGPAPAACTFARDGETRDVRLDWRPVPDNWQERYWAASNGGHSDITLAEPRPGLFLVGLPTFAPGEEGVEAYRKLNADIAVNHATLAKARAIVLDLRLNQGGSSEWSAEVARSLWGEKAVETRMTAYNQPVEIWWRNSSGNIAYLESLDPILRKNGQAGVADEIRKLTGRMKTELAAGHPLTVEEPADLSTPPPEPAPATLSTPVYVIVPGQCASACLDALDVFTRFADVTLVGAPSSGDSLYMEVRDPLLPSGLGKAIIPLKVWLHRPRGGGTIYRPRIELRQADWSTGAFLDLVEADLSKRAAAR